MLMAFNIYVDTEISILISIWKHTEIHIHICTHIYALALTTGGAGSGLSTAILQWILVSRYPSPFKESKST